MDITNDESIRNNQVLQDGDPNTTSTTLSPRPNDTNKVSMMMTPIEINMVT